MSTAPPRFYWTRFDKDKILEIPDELEKALDEYQWTSVQSQVTTNGSCHICLHYLETEFHWKDYRIMPGSTHKAKLLQVSHDRQLISSKEIAIPSEE